MSIGAFVSWLSSLGRRLTSLNRPSVSLSLRETAVYAATTSLLAY